jgi:hypothetical protein
MKTNLMISETTCLQKWLEFNSKLTHPIEEQRNEPIVVYNFIFPDGHMGILKGYNRGVGPIALWLEDREIPVEVYTDTGDLYGFIFDKRNSEMENKPTFHIGDIDYYNRILECRMHSEKVNPKTGNLIVKR